MSTSTSANMNETQTKTGAGKRPAAMPTVEYTAWCDGDRYREDIFVAVNGHGWHIRRGETVTLPYNVYLVLMQSQAQDAAAAALCD